ncbi:hypothetical protein GCM10009539_53760 [Cryptosporangium japonicum]|uniref:Diaminopimelate epimerase n=1 Tax=Cryptosporangium japonicum TaxID=80872 RepID=A0ABP3EEW4_9ACTN
MSDSAPAPGTPVSGPVPFAKGHGTENDFVIVPDPDGVLEIPPQLVRALCDRRAGIGADGLLRVVRTTRIPEGLGLDGEWFMDYRNGDGSIAEMCGNGIRVFARYLVEAGLAKPGTMRISTRAGTKLVVVPDGQSDITVDMGPAVIGSEAVVQVGGRSFAGISVSMGNPHLVCGTVLPVEDLDLTSPPDFDPAAFPTGVNVEIVNVLAGDARTTPGVPSPDGYDLRVRMRVYERGSGETRSCGTGACAVGAVALRSAGKTTGRVAVDVPGGRVAITVTTATTLLEGPAVLVAGGQLSPEWLAAAAARPVIAQAPSEPEGPRAVLGEVVEPTPPATHTPSHAAPSDRAPSRPAPSHPAPPESAPPQPAPAQPASPQTAPHQTAPPRPAPPQPAPAHPAPPEAAPSPSTPSPSAPSRAAGSEGTPSPPAVSSRPSAPEAAPPGSEEATRADARASDGAFVADAIVEWVTEEPVQGWDTPPRPHAEADPAARGWDPARGRPQHAPPRSSKGPARSVAPAGPVPSVEPVSPAAPVRHTSPAPPVRPVGSRRRGEATGSWGTISPSADITGAWHTIPTPEPTAPRPTATPGAERTGSWPTVDPGVVTGEPVVTPGLGALLKAVTAPVVEAIAEESADEQPPAGTHAFPRPAAPGRPPHTPPPGAPGEPAAVGPRA